MQGSHPALMFNAASQLQHFAASLELLKGNIFGQSACLQHDSERDNRIRLNDSALSFISTRGREAERVKIAARGLHENKPGTKELPISTIDPSDSLAAFHVPRTNVSGSNKLRLTQETDKIRFVDTHANPSGTQEHVRLTVCGRPSQRGWRSEAD